VRQARWHRQLGDAYEGLGRLPESRQHAERAVALLGWPVPATRLRSLGDLAGQALRRGSRRVWPGPLLAGASIGRDAALEAARAYERLAILNYYASARVQLARQACAALRQYARAFPIARPRAWLYQGLRAHRSGHHRRALAAWRKSLITAERLAMPCEQGRAHYQIGRHLPAGHPAQQAHLTRAGQIFTDIGALYELGQVQAAMSRS
jgi:tetratricopeptide (TPR) repeat protein